MVLKIGLEVPADFLGNLQNVLPLKMIIGSS